MYIDPSMPFVIAHSTKVSSFVRFCAYTSLYRSHILHDQLTGRSHTNNAPHELFDVELLEFLDVLVGRVGFFADIDRSSHYPVRTESDRTCPHIYHSPTETIGCLKGYIISFCASAAMTGQAHHQANIIWASMLVVSSLQRLGRKTYS